MSSNWLQNDLSQLRDSDLETQLGTIFGRDLANKFINPTIEDKPQSVFVRSFTKKNGSVGAHDLWHSLRNNSQEKLSRKTGSLLDLHLNSLPKNSTVLKEIELRRHKSELMYRVAQLNEKKTIQLLNHVKLPTVTGELVMDPGPEKYCVFPEQDFNPHVLLTSIRKEKDNEAVNETNSNLKNKSKFYDKNKVISYLTEDDCKLPGKFRTRMKELGVDSNVGITKLDQTYLMTSLGSSVQSVAHNYKQGPHTRKRMTCLQKSSKWQPLTVNALVEYTRVIPVPGEGSFKGGVVSVWKPAP